MRWQAHTYLMPPHWDLVDGITVVGRVQARNWQYLCYVRVGGRLREVNRVTTWETAVQLVACRAKAEAAPSR